MPITFVLVHSPLVGPYTWEPVAGELLARGHSAVAPSLLDVLQEQSLFGQAMASAVREQLGEAGLEYPYLVAHSAAGAYLPAIGAGLNVVVAGYIFVDARLPAHGISLSEADGKAAAKTRRNMAQDGWLPRWSEWFDPGALQEVIPEGERRARFLAELQPIPLSLFDEPIAVPSSWPDAPCSYIRLSEFYGPQAEAARAGGWRVLETRAQHMHMLVNANEVVEMILELAT